MFRAAYQLHHFARPSLAKSRLDLTDPGGRRPHALGCYKSLTWPARWSMKLLRHPACLLSAMVVLGSVVVPALAAEEEAHVVILNG